MLKVGIQILDTINVLDCIQIIIHVYTTIQARGIGLICVCVLDGGGVSV